MESKQEHTTERAMELSNNQGRACLQASGSHASSISRYLTFGSRILLSSHLAEMRERSHEIRFEDTKTALQLLISGVARGSTDENAQPNEEAILGSEWDPICEL